MISTNSLQDTTLVDDDGNYIPWKVRLLKNERKAKNSKVHIVW